MVLMQYVLEQYLGKPPDNKETYKYISHINKLDQTTLFSLIL